MQYYEAIKNDVGVFSVIWQEGSNIFKVRNLGGKTESPIFGFVFLAALHGWQDLSSPTRD